MLETHLHARRLRQVAARHKRNLQVLFKPIQSCMGFKTRCPANGFNNKPRSCSVKMVKSFLDMLLKAGMMKTPGRNAPIVPEGFQKCGNFQFQVGGANSNGSAIRMAAGVLLGEEVTPEGDADVSRNPDRLAFHVGNIADLAVTPTAITFDQLVSGRIPDDAPTDDPRDFVAIVHFEDNGKEFWVPHVCIPTTGLVLPNSSGNSTHLGTVIRKKCTEEEMDDRSKAATNVAQQTMKEEGGPRQPCPRCRIFYLCKVKKPRAKKRKHRNEP